MTALTANVNDLDADALAELEDVADLLAAPANFNPDWEGHWPRSYRALDALRSLINTLTSHGVLSWEDGAFAGVTAAFDSDGEQTDTESINITVPLPNRPMASRFSVFVTILVGDIDELLTASERTAAACAEAVAKALSEAVADARTPA